MAVTRARVYELLVEVINYECRQLNRFYLNNHCLKKRHVLGLFHCIHFICWFCPHEFYKHLHDHFYDQYHRLVRYSSAVSHYLSPFFTTSSRKPLCFIECHLFCWVLFSPASCYPQSCLLS